ncbi:MAG: hypothetical protein ACK4TA_22365 [Saprospiraceae bacterium]
MKFIWLLSLILVCSTVLPSFCQDTPSKNKKRRNNGADLSLGLSHGVWKNDLSNVFGLGLKANLGLTYETSNKIWLSPYIGGQAFGKSVGDLDGIREVLLRVNGGLQIDYFAFGKNSHFNPVASVQYSWVSSYFVNELYNFNNQETTFRLSDPSMVAHTVSLLPGMRYRASSGFYLIFEIDLLFPNMKITDRVAELLKNNGYTVPKPNIMDLSHASIRFGWNFLN